MKLALQLRIDNSVSVDKYHTNIYNTLFLMKSEYTIYNSKKKFYKNFPNIIALVGCCLQKGLISLHNGYTHFISPISENLTLDPIHGNGNFLNPQIWVKFQGIYIFGNAHKRVF